VLRVAVVDERVVERDARGGVRESDALVLFGRRQAQVPEVRATLLVELDPDFEVLAS
jgi:hypothetical protein